LDSVVGSASDKETYRKWRGTIHTKKDPNECDCIVFFTFIKSIDNNNHGGNGLGERKDGVDDQVLNGQRVSPESLSISFLIAGTRERYCELIGHGREIVGDDATIFGASG